MAIPTNRSQFIENCLRRLGKPVVEINVDDDQVDDRVDEALRYYWDYHFDGSEKIYYKQQITAQDKANRYITMPENIIGVVNIFEIGQPVIAAKAHVIAEEGEQQRIGHRLGDDRQVDARDARAEGEPAATRDGDAERQYPEPEVGRVSQTACPGPRRASALR